MKARFVLVFVMMTAFATSRDAVAEIVGLWLLNEDKGDIAFDSSGRGHDGKITDGKWVDGKFDKALQFKDGTHMEVNDHEDFHFKTEFSVALWANIEDLPKNHVGIPGKGHDAPIGSFVFHPTKLNAKEFELRFYISKGGDWPSVKSGAIPFGKWHHLAGTYDGSELKVYVNGKLAAKGPQKGKINISKGAPFKFAHDCCGQRTIVGILDEIQIANSPLTQDEIKKSIEGINLAVEPSDKLATTWGTIKSR